MATRAWYGHRSASRLCSLVLWESFAPRVAALAGVHNLSVLLVKPLSWWSYFGGTHGEEAGASGRWDIREKLLCGAVSVLSLPQMTESSLVPVGDWKS